MESSANLMAWVLFIGIVLILLVIDLGLFSKEDHEIGAAESIKLSCFYIAIAILFGGWIYYKYGGTKSGEYFTGYLIEKSLSLDNIFVISIIFEYFKVPRKFQHRVLFWGILGVIIMRGIMIGLGAKLVSEFSIVMYIFSAFLIFTGIKMLFIKEHNTDFGHNRLLVFLNNHLRVTPTLVENKFFVMLPDNTSRKKLWCTPLFICLLMIEAIDAIFAVDSVPAIFAITTDPYIVYTSNIFAILGLRALYFALAAIIPRFHYLKYAISLVLIFIGSKLFISDLFGFEKFPASISLTVTFSLLAGGVILSLYKTRNL
jgi:tellurite resistance protein TerC